MLLWRKVTEENMASHLAYADAGKTVIVTYYAEYTARCGEIERVTYFRWKWLARLNCIMYSGFRALHGSYYCVFNAVVK